MTRIINSSQKVFILKVMTHAEYDEDKWKEDCGCFEPPPSEARQDNQGWACEAKETRRLTMATKTQFRLKGKNRDSYMELVLDFPLASIKSDEHLEVLGNLIRLLHDDELVKRLASTTDSVHVTLVPFSKEVVDFRRACSVSPAATAIGSRAGR